MTARVFIDDSDGGRYVECPDALAAHLDHLERRANGAEIALVKCQRELKEARLTPAPASPRPIRPPFVRPETPQRHDHGY